MTSITNLATGGYYQLSNTNSGTSSSNSNDALLQALLAPNSKNNTGNNDPFFLDLSPQAQQILDAVQSTNGTANLFGSGSFVLTSQQQQQINDILAKYKDAPYTQDTFNQIQNDLKAAGLSPETMALQDQVKSFNPAMILLDALNGTTGSSDALGFANSDTEGKSSAYMQKIISQWQNLSSTYKTQGVTA